MPKTRENKGKKRGKQGEKKGKKRGKKGEKGRGASFGGTRNRIKKTLFCTLSVHPTAILAVAAGKFLHPFSRLESGIPANSSATPVVPWGCGPTGVGFTVFVSLIATNPIRPLLLTHSRHILGHCGSGKGRLRNKQFETVRWIAREGVVVDV